MRLAGVLAACAIVTALAADLPGVTLFSTMPAGALRAPWREVSIARIRPLEFAIVPDDGTAVLRARAEAAAGSAMHAVDGDSHAAPMLAWRWKVDGVVRNADLEARSGDDFAARVYVFFDVPLDELSFGQRLKLRIARALYGEDLPAAALCYVWDNRHAVGTIARNAYTERVRMIVLESGAERAGRWVDERRDVEADYRDAFGLAKDTRVPRVNGIGAGADTDQTKEKVTAWFGDFRFGPRP